MMIMMALMTVMIVIVMMSVKIMVVLMMVPAHVVMAHHVIYLQCIMHNLASLGKSCNVLL